MASQSQLEQPLEQKLAVLADAITAPLVAHPRWHELAMTFKHKYTVWGRGSPPTQAPGGLKDAGAKGYDRLPQGPDCCSAPTTFDEAGDVKFFRHWLGHRLCVDRGMPKLPKPILIHEAMHRACRT